MKPAESWVAEYEQRGYVAVPNLLSTNELAELRQRIDDIQEGRVVIDGATYEPSDGSGVSVAARPAMRKLTDLAPVDPLFRRIACKREIVDIAAELIGRARHVLLYADQALLKPAHHGSAKPLHQDNSYFHVAPMDFGVTCWLAIDDATVENGCMNYIPESHKLGLIPHREIANTPHRVPTAENLDAEVPCPVPAGSAIFHHLLTLHSSKANQSPQPRRAWALHYLNAEARCGKDTTSMLTVRM